MEYKIQKIDFDEIKLILFNMEKSINTKLELIEKKIDNLDEKISKNENELSELKTSCSKMDNHIEFVENTYDKLRAPLGFIKKNVERFIGYSNKEENNLPALPAPKDNK